MADTVETRWLYPPNWSGVLPPQGLGFGCMTVKCTGVSDATGETDAIKVNLSELAGPSGRPVVRTVIEQIWYEIEGLSIVLEWKRNPDIPIAILNAGTVAGSVCGTIDFTNGGKTPGLVDPGGEGTGDIVLTSTNAGAGDSYNVMIQFRCKED